MTRSVLALTFASVTTFAFAQPNIVSTRPQGVVPGQTVNVVFSGSGMVGAKDISATFPVTAKLAAVDANGTNDAQVTFEFVLPPDAPLGIHALRVLTPGGVSAQKLFVVDDLPSVAEVAGNNTLTTAQEVTLPCAVDGLVDNLSRDFFKFAATRGQTLSFEILARRLGSPLDASLYLYQANGHELAYSDDAEGLTSDPQLSYTFAEDGIYLVEVRDIRYLGGGTHHYRLRMGDFPCINVPVPATVQKGVKTRVDFAGSRAADAAPAWVEVPADSPLTSYQVSTKRPGGVSSAFTSVGLSGSAELVEQEPNDTLEQANALTLGTSINGRFEKADDVDRFKIDAQAGQRFLFSGVTRQLGAPTDLQLRILDAAGTQVALVDDEGGAEGVLNYTFPAAGVFYLEVTDLIGRHGGQYAYHVDVTPYQVGFSVAAGVDALNIPAGNTVPITVSVVRRDYGDVIEVTAVDLPAGVTASPTRIGPGLVSTVMTLVSAADAPQATLTQIRVLGKASIGGVPFEAQATVTDAVRTRWSNTKVVPAVATRSVSASVAPAKPLVLRTEPAEIIFGKELKATVKVIAERGEGIDEAITLATEPAANALPGNVVVALKPIDKGQTEVLLEFTANENAPLGPFSVVFSGVHNKANVITTTWTPTVNYRLDPALTITTESADRKLAKSNQLSIKVTIQRNPAFTGEVKLTADKLPAGVTAAEVVIPADKSEADLILSATAEAAPGPAPELTINAVAVANAKLAAAVKVATVTVE